MRASDVILWFARRLYRVNLRLLPTMFQTDYGGQMLLDFDDVMQVAKSGGVLRVVVAIGWALVDIWAAAVREHCAAWSSSTSFCELTPRARVATEIATARAESTREACSDVHLLVGLTMEPHGLAGIVLRQFGIDSVQLLNAPCLPETQLNPKIDGGGAVEYHNPSGVERWLPIAAECARSMGHSFVGTEHLALAILHEPDGIAARTIEQLNVNPAALKRALVVQTTKLRFDQCRWSPRFLKGICVISALAIAMILATMRFFQSDRESGVPRSDRAKTRHGATSAKNLEVNEVKIERKQGKGLSATLFRPSSIGRLPAIVIIPGAGPYEQESRHEPGGGARAGDVLCEFLARQDFVVLRLRRGGGATGHEDEPSIDDLADDAMSCIEFLREDPRVDAGCVGILGHSAGGLVAMMAAARSEQVSFLVTTATPIMPIDSIATDLLDNLLRGTGATDDERRDATAKFKNVFVAIEEGKKPVEIRPQLTEVFRVVYERMPKEQRERSGKSIDELTESSADHQLKTFASPWFKSLLGRDPAALLAESKCPALVIYARNDVKIAPDKCAQIATNALNKRARNNGEVCMIDDADHTFETATEAQGVELSSKFLAALSKWLRCRVQE